MNRFVECEMDFILDGEKFSRRSEAHDFINAFLVVPMT